MGKVLEYKGYTAQIDFTFEDDGYFFGRIDDIMDSVSFEGCTFEEVQSAFFEAVDDYLEACASVGKNPDKPFRGSFNIRIKPELHRELVVEARKQESSLNAYIEQILDQRHAIGQIFSSE